jgi:enoyl-CoA hydratase/carnithine racemase
VLNIDDGKANALSPTLIAALHAGLDGPSAKPAPSVSQPSAAFCAGFDLSTW